MYTTWPSAGSPAFKGLESLVWRRISCHGRNYSQPYFFKRNQSSDNRNHGFGAKFLLKKLSASDFSYERKSAFKVWHIPDSYNFVCGYNVPLEYLCLMDSENLKALYYDP